MQRTLAFFVPCLFCLALLLLGGCSNSKPKNQGTEVVSKDTYTEIADKDFSEIRDYDEQIGLQNIRNYLDANSEANFDAWIKAADSGNPKGQILIGWCYFFGIKVPEDKEVAANWWRKAAEKGNADGEWWLGQCYHNGWGVPKDVAEANKWIRRAERQGHHFAIRYVKIQQTTVIQNKTIIQNETKKPPVITTPQPTEEDYKKAEKGLQQMRDFRDTAQDILEKGL